MKNYYQNIIGKLERTNKKINFLVSLSGVLKFIFYFSVSVTGLLLVEAVFNLGSEIRTVIFFVFLLFAAGYFFIIVLLPILKNLKPFSNFNINKIAKLVGGHYPNIKDDLLNALQLVNESSPNYSEELIQAAFKKVYEKTENINFTDSIKFQDWNKVRVASASLLTVLILILFVPFLNSAYNRLINYNQEFVEPPKYVLKVEPGNVDVTKGENVLVKIISQKDIPSSVNLFTRSAEQAAFEQINLTADSTGTFSYLLKSLNNSTDYYASAEDIKTDVFSINVMDRPIIRKLEMTITPPAYTGLSQTTQVDNGSAEVLPGTRLNYKITSTKPLSIIEQVIPPEDKNKFTINGTEASGQIYVREKFNYYFHLVDTANVSNINPITYSINLKEDAYPQVEILKPGENIELGLETVLPLTIKMEDDYGFSSLKLQYQLTTAKQQKNNEPITLPITINKKEKQQEVYYAWDITPLNLKEDDIVSYFVVAADNDNINGPKETRSKVYTIRVPSLSELFANADQKQNEAENELTQTLEEAKQLGEEFQKISDELKKDERRITWEEKEKIEKALQKFENLEKKVDEIQKQIDEVRKDLAENNLLSEETLQKYLELQELMDQLSSEEMRKAFEKMREQLESLMRDQVQNQMENIQFNEEMFKKSIERTVNLLKRIQIEQKMDELLKRTEDLQEKLSELNEQTEQSDLGDQQQRDELSEEQNSLQKDLEELEEQTQELSERMSEFDDMPKEEAQELANKLSEQNNAELNQKATQQIQQSQKNTAMQTQQQMMKNMESAMQSMQSMQANMRMQSQMKVMTDMMKALDDILTLSKEEEELKNQTNQQQSSSSMRENARQQSEIQNNLDKVTRRIAEMSQKTFGITPEMGKALGQARREMSQSIMDMQQNNAGKASQAQERAMKNMNEAAMLMKNSLEMMMSGQGSGGGMMSLMQQLQQMSMQQMNLNQMTQMMNQGKLTQEQMAQMQRLAQEQAMIRKSLQQLNEEAKSSGQSKKLSSNLEEILKEMEEVVADIRSNNVDDELLQKQEHILSKLLDAQRSINERDYEKERESFAGQNFQRETPPELMLSTEEGLQKLRDELLNSSKEGYKKDYEELIRKYFEALQKEQIKN